MKSLFMETSTVTANRSRAEIHELLAQAGARAIQYEYGDDQRVVGVAFLLRITGRDIPFLLPVRVQRVEAKIRERVRRPRRGWEERLHNDAERIAWRQAFRWLQAQMAFIDTGMVKSLEVFMPYAQTGPNQTLYEKLEAENFKMLPSPNNCSVSSESSVAEGRKP